MADIHVPAADVMHVPAAPAVPSAAQLFRGAAAHGARLLCRVEVVRADAAAAALETGGGAALDALLVAIRNLRATVDAYAPVLAGLSPEIVSRRAAALARVLASPATQGLADDPMAGRRLRERWAQLVTPLRPALDSWRERHSLDGSRRSTPFPVAAAAALERATDRVARRVIARTALVERDSAHAVEGAARALLAVLTPLAAVTPDGNALLTLLQSDGSVLSTWHDPAVRAARVSALVALAGAWRTMGEPPLEIERKWLLSALPPQAVAAPVTDLAQGYLPGEALVERIRRRSNAGSVEWIRTVKLGRGIARIEVEEVAAPALGEALFALTEGRRVHKRRYTVADGARHWEIDAFTDRVLVLAELELDHADAVVEFPPWLAPYVLREVTDDRAFTNWQLAR